MALYVHPLNPQERQQLEALVAQPAADLPAQRVLVVLLSAEGKSVREISQTVKLHPINVRKWIHRFTQHGVTGLRTGKSPGRPHRFTPKQRQRIVELAQADPRNLGLPFTCWSLVRLRRYVIEQGVVRRISIEGLRKMLQTAAKAGSEKGGSRILSPGDDKRSQVLFLSSSEDRAVRAGGAATS